MELGKLKQLLGIDAEDTSKDTAVAFAMASAEEMILNYCNIDTVPEGLQYTSCRMAIALYRNENTGHEENALGSVSSITAGDTTTSFNASVDESFKESLLNDYKPQLNRYRRVVF